MIPQSYSNSSAEQQLLDIRALLQIEETEHLHAGLLTDHDTVEWAAWVLQEYRKQLEEAKQQVELLKRNYSNFSEIKD